MDVDNQKSISPKKENEIKKSQQNGKTPKNPQKDGTSKKKDAKSSTRSTRSTSSTKKKPGRPRKKRNRKMQEREGIVDKPANYETAEPSQLNTMELLYDNPLMFRKLFMLFKSMAVNDIQMNFEKTHVTIVTQDHKKKSIVYVKINGIHLVRYYCDHPITIGLDPGSVEQIIQQINKDYTTITFVSRKSTERSQITLCLHHGEMESDKIYDIDVVQTNINIEDIEKTLKLEENYPIKFTLPYKFFKKDINDYCGLATRLTIEKHGEGPLYYSYRSKNNKVRHIGPFRNPNKIQLHSTISKDDIFATSFYLADVKSLSSSLISDDITIAADQFNDLIFTAYLDENEDLNDQDDNSSTCVIKVMTKIINLAN